MCYSISVPLTSLPLILVKRDPVGPVAPPKRLLIAGACGARVKAPLVILCHSGSGACGLLVASATLLAVRVLRAGGQVMQIEARLAENGVDGGVIERLRAWTDAWRSSEHRVRQMPEEFWQRRSRSGFVHYPAL